MAPGVEQEKAASKECIRCVLESLTGVIACLCRLAAGKCQGLLPKDW